MLATGYDRRFASGIVCCAGTLGTIVPPSIILVMLSGQMRLAARETVVPGGGSVSINFLQIFLGVMLPWASCSAPISRTRSVVLTVDLSVRCHLAAEGGIRTVTPGKEDLGREGFAQDLALDRCRTGTYRAHQASDRRM